MDNVIEKQELDKHTIQRYRFKVLGSSLQEEGELEDIELQKENEETAIPVENVKISQDENKFIEELLKKSDELSSNIIKLQMQIERQESDFNTRLESEILRQKEISTKEGYEKAKLELEDSFKSSIENYKNSAQKLDEKLKEIDSFLKKVEDDVANTAVEVAKEVVKKEISNSSSAVAIALAKQLLEELKDANKIIIKVNPEDFKILKDIYKDNEKIKIEADKAISKGGVVLLSENGNLDGNISQRFEKVKYLLQSN
ncbi:MAG: flagellar assembly protein FliH [Epsilonproteobacteria bacterium]|nr:flagellar assembly protein FliH [Campylobacterota bacterium]